MNSSKQGRFNKALLPSPYFFYTKIEKLALDGKATGKGWSKALCPFHSDTTPSLSINLEIGCFTCFACGEKGSDVLAFYMKRHNKNFINACKDLGAWEI